MSKRKQRQRNPVVRISSWQWVMTPISECDDGSTSGTISISDPVNSIRAGLEDIAAGRVRKITRAADLLDETTCYCGDAHGSKCGYCETCLAEKETKE